MADSATAAEVLPEAGVEAEGQEGIQRHEDAVVDIELGPDIVFTDAMPELQLATSATSQPSQAISTPTSGGTFRAMPTSGSRLSSAVVAWKSSISSWRWPEKPGEMPLYVQRKFRVKAFGLLGIQLTCVLVEMLLVDRFVRPLMGPWTGMCSSVFYMSGTFSLGLIFALHFAKDQFPLNYALMCTTTCMVGVFWGMSPLSVYGYLHFQLIGMLAICMLTSTAVVGLGTRKGTDPMLVLHAAPAFGWLVACYIDLWITQHWGLSSMLIVFVAMLTTAVLIAMVLVLDTGELLRRCNPDDFARVVVAMDSALLVVGMPIFVLSCCFLHADAHQRTLGNHEMEEAPPELPSAAARAEARAAAGQDAPLPRLQAAVVVTAREARLVATAEAR